MKIRTKRNILIFIIFPFGAALIFFLIGSNMIISFPLMVIFGFLVLFLDSKIKCPRCGRPVGLRKFKWGCIEFEMEIGFTKKKCDYCEESFI